eukprot:2832650-Rhodomonas_salina.1
MAPGLLPQAVGQRPASKKSRLKGHSLFSKAAAALATRCALVLRECVVAGSGSARKGVLVPVVAQL